jgi:hypothetical protein
MGRDKGRAAFQPCQEFISGWRRVFGNARFSSAREPAEPMFFLSAFQLKSVMASVNEIEIRAAGDPVNIIGEVRRAVYEIDPKLPVTNVTTLQAQVNDSVGQQRLISGLTGLFGILALVLTAVGLYGSVAYNVIRRTHEIGIRVALGAKRSDVLGLIVGQAQANVRRRRRWTRRCARAYAHPCQPPLWCQANGPSHLHRSLNDSRRCRAARQLHSRAAGDESGPDDCPAV